MVVSDIRQVLVVGAGTMGHGIAQVFACGGLDVRLFDTDSACLDRSRVQIRSNLETMVEASVLSASEIDGIVGRIDTSTDLEEAGRGVDLAIEAVPEDEEIKREVFRRLEQVCPEEAILASNTSSLNVFEFTDLTRPERLCVAHWYAPAFIIPLVDVVQGSQTSPEVIDTIVELLTRLGKKPVVMKKFVPGYAINRLQSALNREVNYLLDNGIVEPRDLDDAVRASIAPRMMLLGVVQRVDFTGLDVSLAIQKELARDATAEPTFDTIQALVDQGRLGVKTGRGFYDYGGRSAADVLKERDLALLKLFKRA